MQSINVVQNLIPKQSSTSTVSLKDGQLIYGKVHHIYSNQTAEISIGQTKIMAKLDAPIIAGERYLFQVQNSGEMTTLKVLPHEGKTQTVQERAHSLLQHLSFVQSKESAALAQFFVKNDIPITKEQMLQAFQWANKTEDMTKALQALKIMHDLSLPFTEHVYRAMVAYGSQETLPALFSKVLNGLGKGTTDNEQALKALLTHFLSSDVEKQADSGVRRLVSTWISSEGEMKNTAFRVLQEIGYLSKQESPFDILTRGIQLSSGINGAGSQENIKQTVQLLLQMSGKTGDNHSNLVNQLIQLVTKGMLKTGDNTAENIMWKQSQNVLQNTGISMSNKSDFTQGVQASSGNIQRNILSAQALETIAKQVLAYVHTTDEGNQSVSLLSTSIAGEKNFEQAKRNLGNILLQFVDGKSMLKGDSQFLQRFLQEEIRNLLTPKSELIANELKTTFRLLGLSFENYLGSMDYGTTVKENELLTLKPLLLKQLNEAQSQSLKDNIELLVNKITAQQILSQSSGPIQHLIVQFPFSLQQNKHEVTMQWSGRKKPDGSIDPTFCRILFYLQLDNIKETVIDVIVQNSIMKVTILNERAFALKAVSQPYLAKMKEKLDESGYKVSSISFEKPASSRFSVPNTHEKETISYSGVDIKI